MGHGNSAVVDGGGAISVIDGGNGDTLVRFLAQQGIRRVDTVIVSHADADHFGGISLLLSDPNFDVGHVYINPDSRETALWDDFLCVMEDAQGRGVKFSLELNDANPGLLLCGETRLEVLWPSQSLAYRTTRGRDRQGRRLSPNAMSAVVRIWAADVPRLLLTGDIDELGYLELIGRKQKISAETLVFPHHGGRPGAGDPAKFATWLFGSIGAQLVIFSFGRGQYRNPRPEIVEAILRSDPRAHIACTQLSDRCADKTPEGDRMARPNVGRGSTKNASCAGTIEISLANELTYSPTRLAHQEFVECFAPTALCRRYRIPPSL